MQHLSKMLAFTLAAPAEAALSIQLAMQDRVLVEPSSPALRKTRTCSSLDGPFCPLLGTPSDEADDGLRWRLLLRAGEEDSKLRTSTLNSEEHVEIPVPTEALPQVEALPRMWHKSMSLDFSELSPWISHVPLDFSKGMFRKHELTWFGNWRVTTASREGRNSWTAAELSGHGSIKFSRAVVVSELAVEPIEGTLVVLGYLGSELIWRRRVRPRPRTGEWLNGACSLWAVDKLVFLPVGSAILGGLIAAASTSTSTSSHVTEGFVNNDNMIPVTLLSLDRPGADGEARWMPRRTTISPSAASLSLREAWSAREPLIRSQAWNTESEEAPALEDLKLVFEALEAGMELPVGVTWSLIQAEAARFHLVMSEYTDVKNIKRWWPEMWNTHQFYVLEACFLRWLDTVQSRGRRRAGSVIPQPRRTAVEESANAADGTESATLDAFFQGVLGSEAGSLLSDLVQRYSKREDNGFVGDLEAAINDLMGNPVVSEGSSPDEELVWTKDEPWESMSPDAHLLPAESVAANAEQIQRKASVGFLQRREQPWAEEAAAHAEEIQSNLGNAPAAFLQRIVVQPDGQLSSHELHAGVDVAEHVDPAATVDAGADVAEHVEPAAIVDVAAVSVAAATKGSQEQAVDTEAAETDAAEDDTNELKAKIEQEESEADSLMETAESLAAELKLLQELLQESLQQKKDMLARLTSAPLDEKP
mmetsp:Transcript_63250/g.119703  ORF Transcript_63250/g.119703 Transcript_63250/m.119703 type:complete len:704 (+) Transcript_63250:131-2242(+)